MKIYRMENAERIGPFQSDARYIYDANHRCRDKYHGSGNGAGPIDNQERGTALYRHFVMRSYGDSTYVFGFRSLRQLRLWFRSPKGRVAMASTGTIPVVYEVHQDHVLMGNSQLAFDPSKATMVAKLNPRTLKED